MSTFYHVYCETMNEETITPDYNDAYSTFYRYVRCNPSEQVDFDSITGDNSMQDIAEGVFEGKRERVMQCVPW